MRIFLYGNEEVAKWHLPVIEEKFSDFVSRCEKAGLKQDRFTLYFEEDGTEVYGQYIFGQSSIQVYSPWKTVKVVKEKLELPEVEPKDKTFYVSTTKGYFWVEVRYVDNAPQVILTPFVGQNADGSWAYAGMGLVSPGMKAGTLDDTAKSRYVVCQSGGVVGYKDEKKGSILSIAICDNRSKLTPGQFSHEFYCMKSFGGQNAELRKITISGGANAIAVKREYASIDMAYEGETNILLHNLNPNPVWVHRKCSGSYFSPNKTIGYHVDIGADDAFLGNMQAVRGGDLLDNTGGAGESLFNHTLDLYRLASLVSFPVAVSGNEVTLLLVAPTMGFIDDPLTSKKCWGGYGIFQDQASCADYMQDFSSWLLSPRFVKVSFNFASGEKSIIDLSVIGNSSDEWEVKTWDGQGKARIFAETEYYCDNDYYDEMGMQAAAEQCTWDESCRWTCDTNDPGSDGNCPKGWTPYDQWKFYFRENLRNKKRFWFTFGDDTPTPSAPEKSNGFYLLFDGLWHLDVGNYWTSSKIEGNYCGLCSYPLYQQDPGGYITFAVQGVDPRLVMETGHESVENLEVVAPLGWHPWPMGGTIFGFIARVPEEYAAPHEPVVVTGRIEYAADNVSGELVQCERHLYTDPCICAGDFRLDEYSSFQLGQTGTVQVLGGCPPFTWRGTGARIDGKAYLVTDQRTFAVEVYDDCTASLKIKDACGQELSMSALYTKTPAASGPLVLDQNETGYYIHNLDDAVYTGTLLLVETRGNAAILRMPPGAADNSTYYASWSGRCGTEVSTPVICAFTPCCQYDYVGIWGVCNPPPAPAANSMIHIINYAYTGKNHCVWLGAKGCAGCTAPTSCSGVGWWKPFFPGQGGGNQLWETTIPDCRIYGYGNWPAGCRNESFADNESVHCP